jgi:tRNA-2-methylthio-N6-dimethylallyladenosine synthase
MQTFYLWTIGCQMNFADSWRLERELLRLGFRAAERAESADLVVLNTCVVRQHAEDKCVGRLTSLAGWKRKHPGALLAVMGCLVGDQEALRRAYPHIDLFLQPSDYMGLVHHLCDHDLAPTLEAGAAAAGSEGEIPVSVHVPISYGCDHRCTYCIVRLRRGRERSRPLDEIVDEVRALVARGVREVTLLGQNVDSYGHDLLPLPGPQRPGRGIDRPPGLADLLYAVHEIEDLWRIRFLTSHPADLHPSAIEAVAELSRVCPHFELPIQAGDDEVLRRMARGYTVDQYRALIAGIRERVPGCSVATDVIVGFPGETEAQFEATYRLLQELRFDAVHAAAYSERPGTPAARMEDDVSHEEKLRRRTALDDLQAQILAEINAPFLGQVVEVLVEEHRKGRWGGRTLTNKLVFFDDDARTGPTEAVGVDRRGTLVPVRVTWTGPWSMIGELALSE